MNLPCDLQVRHGPCYTGVVFQTKQEPNPVTSAWTFGTRNSIASAVANSPLPVTTSYRHDDFTSKNKLVIMHVDRLVKCQWPIGRLLGREIQCCLHRPQRPFFAHPEILSNIPNMVEKRPRSWEITRCRTSAVESVSQVVLVVQR